MNYNNTLLRCKKSNAVYKIYNIVSYKTNTKGFWIDKNKVYTDNIIIKDVFKIEDVKKLKNVLFKDKKQLAVFYTIFNTAYIEDAKGNVIELKKHVEYTVKNLSKDVIKDLLKKYNGLTITKNKHNYLISIWS